VNNLIHARTVKTDAVGGVKQLYPSDSYLYFFVCLLRRDREAVSVASCERVDDTSTRGLQCDGLW